MESIIPFTKELDFENKVSEITSISLEREFKVEESNVNGNLQVTGDYKGVTDSISPFSFKIPFTISIPDNLKEDSIKVEINDFAYDMVGDSKIKVNIELELTGEEKTEEQVSVEEDRNTPVNSDELIEMLEKKEKEVSDEPSEEKDTKEAVEETRDVVDTKTILDQAKEKEEEYTTYHVHIMGANETIDTVCSLYHISSSTLNDYNNISEIQPGSKLIIPSSDES